MYKPEEVIWYYKHYGPRRTLARIGSELYLLFLGFLFGLVNSLAATRENHVCMVPRATTVDQDTIGVLDQVTDADVEVYVAVTSVTETEEHYQEIIQRRPDFEFNLIQIHSWAFVKVLASSSIVIFKDRLWQYRLLSQSGKRFIRIPHGLPAKGSKALSDTGCGLQDVVSNWLNLNRNYEYTVASEIELHREAGMLGRDRRNLTVYGYPRFDRIRTLVESPDNALVTESAQELLESTDDQYNVLYAPTHKDGVFETELFPFPDFDREELYSFLSEHNIRIFLRLHVNEAESGIAEEYVDGKHVIDAGYDFAGSAAEIMPYCDALITDYSSIYLDYVLFDRPIIFVQDNIEAFRDLRGFAFDYDRYWPGPKIKEQTEFIDLLESTVVEGVTDEYCYERRFVRDTFHPQRDGQFLERILGAK